MPSVTYKPFMLSVVRLNAIMLSVVVPFLIYISPALLHSVIIPLVAFPYLPLFVDPLSFLALFVAFSSSVLL
jgi:hypothetical protein